MTVGELKIKLSADTAELSRGIDTARGALENMEKGGVSAASGVKSMIAGIAENIRGQSPQMENAGREIFGAVAEGAQPAGEGMLSSITGIMERVKAAIGSYTPEMAQAGGGLVIGIGQGITESTGYLLAKVNTLGARVLNEIESAFEIASPSKRTMYIGEMIGEGLAEGIAKSLSKVEISAGRLYTAAEPAQSVKNIYNTYNSTYNGASAQGDAVNMADFENRIRRAYA
ncbi:MAG: hypothetical protein JXN65_10270 [Clostridia bacterium]|nr:hypothetical protein [Clostridia bacterium]